MIIALNGVLIDTTKIYKIGKIISHNSHHEFTIYHLNDKHSQCIKSVYEMDICNLDTDYNSKNSRDIDSEKYKNWSIVNKEIEKYLPIAYEKLKLAYDVLVAYWSNNQSQIPQINY